MRTHLVLVLTSVLWFAVRSEPQAAPGYMPSVYVDCACDDIVGGNLCYAVKERIRASAGFKLSDSPPTIGIAAHLICVSNSNNSRSAGEQSAAVSITLTTYSPAAGVEFYETALVMVVGGNRVGEMATSIMSDIDKVGADNSQYFATREQQQRDAQSIAPAK